MMKPLTALEVLRENFNSVSIGFGAVEILKEQKKKVDSEDVFPLPNDGPISLDSVPHMLR